ncbi:MAG: hypothetical protein AAGC55_30220 [Myxococcota bacterium]
MSPHDGAALSPAQRREAALILDELRLYYPTWQPERQSRADFYQGWYATAEIQRFKAVIDRHKQSDRAWPALLTAAHAALRPTFAVYSGTPPTFYIPSFELVVRDNRLPEEITLVFRVSMLVPLYDYYEVVRDPRGRLIHIRLAPTDATAAVAQRVRALIARHYPRYRELAPAVGAMRSLSMRSENTMLGHTDLADLLFGDTRSW